MTDVVTLIANNLFVAAALLAIFFRAKWFVSSSDDSRIHQAVWAWTLLEFAILLRIGWWSVAIAVAPEGEHYSEWFVRNKHVVSVLSSLIYAWGTLAFIRLAESFDFKWKIHMLLILIGLAVFPALVGL